MLESFSVTRPMLGKGMLGVFAVISILVIAVAVLNKLSK